MADATTEILNVEGVSYLLRIPKDAHDRQDELRVLVSVHGSNGSACDYLGIVTDHGDDDRYGLIVIAPQFPRDIDAPQSSMHGDNFDSPSSDSHRWLNVLIHCHLWDVLARRGLSVVTNRVYFFGHSRGGQFVHTYMLTHHSRDVLRAAICGAGLLRRRSNASYCDMAADEYRNRLRAFVQADVALIVGTSDCVNPACLTASSMGDDWDKNNLCDESTGAKGQHKWRRIREVMDYFNGELAPLLGEDYMKCIIEQEPPEWHPTGAYFEIVSSGIVIPVADKRVRFFWTPNPKRDNQVIQGHSGRLNYETARKHLFEPVPLTCSPDRLRRAPSFSDRFERLRDAVPDRFRGADD